MERRRYLRWLASAGLAGLAGCSGTPSAPSEGSDPTPATVATETPATPALGAAAVELPVPNSRLEIAGFKDSIPAITEPAFGEDWSEVRLELQQRGLSPEFDFEFEPRLSTESPVVGVERGDAARAYPLGVLNWYEVVNDTYPDGEPVLITYCPLCRTGLVAERAVRGDPTTFGVSGLLYRDNLVMYDEATSSLWSQVRAQAIRGPMTGTRLSLSPSTLTTWGEWRSAHPDTRVLLPPPISGTVVGKVARDVTKNPYGDYANVTRIGVGPGQLADTRLHPKALVVGVRADGVARAYPLEPRRGRGPGVRAGRRAVHDGGWRAVVDPDRPGGRRPAGWRAVTAGQRRLGDVLVRLGAVQPRHRGLGGRGLTGAAAVGDARNGGTERGRLRRGRPAAR